MPVSPRLDLPTVDVNEYADAETGFGYDVGKHFADDDFVGFCKIRVDDDTIEHYRNAQRMLDAFMDLPLEARKQYMMPLTGGEGGYTPQDNAERSRLDGVTTSEGSNPFRNFHVTRDVRRNGAQGTGPVPERAWKRYPRTAMPDEIPVFEETVYDAFTHLEGLAFDLLDGISHWAEEETGYPLDRGFQDYAVHGHHILRMIDYPGQESVPDLAEEDSRIGGHEDQGLVTLLWTDGTPGLRVQKDGEWQYVVHEEDELIINIGEELELLTNGRLPATKHGVDAVAADEDDPSIPPRQSFPFFVHSRAHTRLAPHEAFTVDAGLRDEYVAAKQKDALMHDNIAKRAVENWPEVERYIRDYEFEDRNADAWALDDPTGVEVAEHYQRTDA